MEEKIRIKIETTLGSFTSGQLQDALNLSVLLNANGICFEDIKDYLGEKRDAMLAEEIAFKKSCPECQGQMNLAPVNTGKGDKTGDKSKSVWTCGQCLYQEFNTYTARERMLAVKGEK